MSDSTDQTTTASRSSTASTARRTCTASPRTSSQQVAQEVREHIIDTVGEIGGHFGANLGTCELAVALHSLLDSPRDKILWDVGHQAYPHKVLTGRRDQLPTIRKYDGLAPFCSIAGVRARHHGRRPRLDLDRLRGRAQGGACACGDGPDAGKVVAVIGDGAMTGGVAFEAIHQAGGLGTPIVVVLNDNGMSIAPNVGALSRYFNRVRLNPKLLARARGRRGRPHASCRPASARAFERLGPQLKESIKAFWAPGLFWEELDWAYIGVIDGHDVARAARARCARRSPPSGPVVVHIATVKGKGFAPGRGRRPGGHGEVARRQAQVDRQRRAGAAAPVPRAAPRAAEAAAVHEVFGEALVREVRARPRASSASPPR